MATLIDASVLIEAERGRLDLEELLNRQADEQFALAAITASELLHGVHRAVHPQHRARREVFVEQLLARLPVVAFDLVTARIHARLWAELAAKGVVVGPHDLLIAATAIATGSMLATRDLRSFTHIPGLTIVQW